MGLLGATVRGSNELTPQPVPQPRCGRAERPAPSQPSPVTPMGSATPALTQQHPEPPAPERPPAPHGVAAAGSRRPRHLPWLLVSAGSDALGRPRRRALPRASPPPAATEPRALPRGTHSSPIARGWPCPSPGDVLVPGDTPNPCFSHGEALGSYLGRPHGWYPKVGGICRVDSHWGLPGGLQKDTGWGEGLGSPALLGGGAPPRLPPTPPRLLLRPGHARPGSR